jgi:iron complex outermembrane recepter protein
MTSFQRAGTTPIFIPMHAPAAAGFVFSLLASAFAQAQTTAPTAPAPAQRVEITGTAEPYAPPATSTPTKTDQPVLLTPQSITVVPRAVLNEQKALTLTDAIRNVAGTGTDFGFNGSTQPLLILRGFPSVSMSANGSMSGSSTYFVDGVKLQGVPVNMADVQAVEVVKGPASVLYGRSEPGGLVNVVRRPLSATRSVGFEQTVGQHGLSRTIVEAGGALDGNNTVLGRASLSYLNNGSPRAFVEDKLGGFNGTLAWVPDADTRVTLSLAHIDQKYRTDFGVPADLARGRPIAPNDRQQYNDSPDLSRTRSTTVALDAEQRLAADWRLRAKLVAMRAETKEVDVTPYRIDLATAEDCSARSPAQMCRYYFSARPRGKQKLDQLTVDLLGDVGGASGAQWAGLQHKLLAGIETYRMSKTGPTYLQAVPSTTFLDPRPTGTPALDTTTALAEDRDQFTRWTSLYVQDQVAFGGGWHGVLALRHERSSAIYAAAGDEPNKQSFTTPRIGVVYEITPRNTLYAQFQDSVAANNGRNPADGTALAAERARQLEVGYKIVAFNGAVNSTLALYQLDKRNLADYSRFFGENIISTIGKARSRGVEWDVLGQVTRQLGVIGSYAYTDAKVVDGRTLANVAKHSGSLWARYALGDWALGGGVFFQGARPGDGTGSFTMPGYGRADAMVSYAFNALGAKGSVQLNVNNLFDKVYFTGSHQFVQDWIAVGTPRTVSATLRLDY